MGPDSMTFPCSLLYLANKLSSDHSNLYSMPRGPCPPPQTTLKQTLLQRFQLGCLGTGGEDAVPVGGNTAQTFQRTLFRKSSLYLSRKESHLDASPLSCCESTFWVCTVLRQACLLESVLGKTVNADMVKCHMNRGRRYDFWQRPQGGDTLVPSEASFKFLYLICLI